MKKILLVGDFSDVYRSVGEAITGEYQVQFCPAEAETMHDMIKLSNPNLIVICMPGMEPVDKSIFNTLNGRWGTIPVLVISTRDNFENVKLLCDDKRYKARYIPIKNSEILSACHSIIDPEKVKDPEEDLVWFGKRPDRKKRRKVLVVDDAAIMLRSIKTMLEDEYDILLAKSGEKALKIIAEEMPDIVLLDYLMPEMDGKETFEKIREMVGNSIPVIFLTGVNEKKKILEILVDHPAGYVLKPPDRDQLRIKILETLRESIG